MDELISKAEAIKVFYARENDYDPEWGNIRFSTSDVEEILKSIIPADAISVIRCHECEMWQRYENLAGCGRCKNSRFAFRYNVFSGNGSFEYTFHPITGQMFSCTDGKRKDAEKWGGE